MQDDNSRPSCIPEVNVQKTNTGQLVLQMVLPPKASGDTHPTSEIDTFKRAVKVLVKIQDAKSTAFKKNNKNKKIKGKNKKKLINKKGTNNKKKGGNQGTVKNKGKNMEKKEQQQNGKKGKKRKERKQKMKSWTKKLKEKKVV